MSTPAIDLRPRERDIVATAVPEVRAPDLHAPDADNVVAFIRPARRAEESAEARLAVAAGERSAPAPSVERRAAWRAGLVLASLILHAGLIALLLARAPQPFISGEQPAMTVEIVVGEPAPPAADVAPEAAPREPVTEPAPAENDRAAPPVSEAPPIAATEPAEPPPEATTPPPDEPPPQAMIPPPSDEPQAVTSPPDEPPPQAMTPPPPDEAPTPQAEQPTAADQPIPPPPERAPPAISEPAREPAEVVPRIPVTQPPRPPLHEAAPPRRAAHAAVPRREPAAAAGPAAKKSAPEGRGAPRADPDYYGRVAAHLARYKQFPPEARASRSQGAAAVTFTIDAAGRVTSVRLARASGVASLDREAQAMTRRASPFPPPPTGHAMTFTVPVNFVMR
jgi:TonB family protein